MKDLEFNNIKVPEGATHYHEGNSGDITFYKMEMENYQDRLIELEKEK